MKKGSRFGKYGDQKRLKRLRQVRSKQEPRLLRQLGSQPKRVRKVEVSEEK